MTQLPNGCSCTEIKVTPKNWKKSKDSVSKDWRVYYTFYDPTIGKMPPIVLKADLNRIKDWSQRKEACQNLKDELWADLTKRGYNPYTKCNTVDLETSYEIHPDTPFIEALWKAKGYVQACHKLLRDMKSALGVMDKAAKDLRIHEVPISKISIRYATMLFKRCGEINPRWSARRHNMYRSFIMMLFKVLRKMEAAVFNPEDMELMPVIQKIKKVLTKEQRNLIDNHLHVHHYRFWLFVNLFYHSGARMPELMQQKPTTIDLQAGKFRSIVKKRKLWTEVERTIKDEALPFWKEFLKDCGPDQYLFGVDFLPAAKAMCDDTVGRWWNRIVKSTETGLGIDVNFYRLKHLHTTNMINYLGETEGTKKMAEHNAHTSEAMVIKIYDVERESRKHLELKQVPGGFRVTEE